MKKLIEKYLGEAKKEKCEVCGKSDTKYYEGYRSWLCSDCFDKTKHKELIKMRDKK